MMQILVRTPHHGIVAVPASDNSTFRSLLQRAMKGDTPPQHVKVLFGRHYCSQFQTLAETGVQGGETLHLVAPLRGGGGDGGATGAESRDCYLSMYLDKKPDKVNPNEARLAKWKNCRLSANELTPPCAVDFLGNLFNKECIIEALVGKTLPEDLAHIRGLKDVVTLKIAENPSWTSSGSNTASRFYCPISGQEFNGLFKFLALRSCGHVLSSRALKEVKGSACLVCHTPFTEDDKIVINGSDEEVEVARLRLEDARAKLKLKGSTKKEKKNDVMAGGNTLKTARMVVKSSANEVFGAAGVKRKGFQGKVSGVDKLAAGALSRPKGSDLVEPVKRLKAALPVGASEKVFSSIFTSSKKGSLEETYSCRSLPLGRN